MTDIKPVIYELRPKPTTLGGAIGIPSNGLRLFDRLGVADALIKRGSTRTDVAVYSLNQGKLGRLHDFAAHVRAETGYGYVRIKRVDIVDVLMEAVRKAEIPVHFGKKIQKVENGESRSDVRVQFEDGSSDRGDILVGCDGIHSAVRRMCIDPESKPEYSGLSGMFSTIPASAVSTKVTSQMTGLNVTITAQGMFMAAPCTASQDEIYWGFQREVAMPNVGDTRDGWEVRGREEVDGFKDTLRGIIKDGDGKWIDALRELIDATDVMKFYPIYRLPLGGTWSNGRCLILGDAAHATQPHAGQGVSLAVEDAFLISHLLSDYTRPVSEVNALFERIRRPRVAAIHHTASQNSSTRRNVEAPGQAVKEDTLRSALAASSGRIAISNQLLGQKYATYDIVGERV